MELINNMRIEFASLPSNVAFARVSVAAFASQLDFTLNDLEEIKVAVSEAVTNSIVHGYENRTDETVAISVAIKNNELHITVEDSGKGIEDITQALQPAYSTDPERMGLGFSFIQSFSDNFRIESSPNNGTKVYMLKNCTNIDTSSSEH